MKIKEELIKSVIDIKNRHETLVDDLNHVYSLLTVTNEHLIKYKDELSNIGEDNIKNKQKLFDIFLKYESKIKKLNHDIKPYLEELEKLKKESTILYFKIKELFPNDDDDTLKDILSNDLEEYKNINNITD